ncbi:MAG: type IV pilus assembly protein PilM [Planctomycetales bacterium]
MADIRGVWGIDIGLAGLKAIRLVYAEAAKQVLATAFDYVPHPKILSQPDANPDELIAQALDTFLSRNPLAGDSVAISVPGQTALARFIQLPPVESSKVVEIVKYEARQQIPFALEEVIWDYQPLSGGMEESGFMLDAKVGLFAMKRDQVQQHLAPFLNRKIEVDLVQIAPLALYNFLCHDQFGLAPGNDGQGEQEDYTLVLDMGADNSTLLVSNGKDIWIRNVPLGGNHFTRALTKEMKLTFAKAEHLKCNATKAPDPKAVFQALRPVFNDYVAEIQRSIGFFSSVNREAKIGKILGVGNGFKLAGLQKFLQQNLQMDVERVEAFPALAGDSVINAPLFQENLLSFAVPYGLALQGLNVTRVHTSLLPPEIKTARLIRKKKPWAVATAATLLIGLSISLMGYSHVWSSVSEARFGEAEKAAKRVIDDKNAKKTAYEAAAKKNKDLKTELDNLVAGTEGRTQWLEVYKAINACLPRDFAEAIDEPDPTLKNRIRIAAITATKVDDLGAWFKDKTDNEYARPADKTTPPKGPGYVFRLQGKHFHNNPDTEFVMRHTSYVKNTLLKNLQSFRVEQFDLHTGKPTGVFVPVRQMGITHAVITDSIPEQSVLYHPGGLAALGDAEDGEQEASPVAKTTVGGAKRSSSKRRRPDQLKKPALKVEGDATKGTPIKLSGFVIEFGWKPTPEAARQATDPDIKEVKTDAQGQGANQGTQGATGTQTGGQPGTGNASTPSSTGTPAQSPAGNGATPTPGGSSTQPGAAQPGTPQPGAAPGGGAPAGEAPGGGTPAGGAAKGAGT